MVQGVRDQFRHIEHLHIPLKELRPSNDLYLKMLNRESEKQNFTQHNYSLVYHFIVAFKTFFFLKILTFILEYF